MPSFIVNTLCLTIFCALVYLAIISGADSGPYCPGADPTWLGHCESAPITQ